ncbi:aldo/keto reductase [Weissella paramesenteroides]|jgi:diketogulonate reductase-like aldo/keto reductase|uniref:Aldo/keto reductase n=1 Tax=Weissella paramesenteroides TaxID=1249 RepID=A0ABD4XG80_WEIPA|nr:aldo/keto reductase [Weissella paramesenteroides]KAA8439823.1 aldo/keto reductase [Weissella paramesenteroides]KAA8441420.1 aldo/keto reductase [Weissella paramesenteroides]KAA8444162.1 aldo/keto reductase [Weissella paramesenteroides]KAA8448633.1 aldo/keto reductase [Weissella paramesenteroides]KAA8450742.1 aldo/keto reductase [Weissella paramesenteroides]
MTISSLTDTFTLANGVEIPVVGFGTWQTPDGDVAYQSVLDALKAGYRHIDTAAAYGNEASVGRAIKDSGIPREELFITSKLWNDSHSYEAAKIALDKSLKLLGLDYLDLYLIHWPNPLINRRNWDKANAEAWRYMEDAYTEGKIRAIGISNFQIEHVEALLKTATIRPMVNQLFINPSDLEQDIVAFNEAHDILTEAYSPLGTGSLLAVPEINDIAEKYGKSAAQVLIRWSLQHGFLPLPKSTHAERISQNADVFDFELTDAEIAALDQLEGVAGTHQDASQADF